MEPRHSQHFGEILDNNTHQFSLYLHHSVFGEDLARIVEFNPETERFNCIFERETSDGFSRIYPYIKEALLELQNRFNLKPENITIPEHIVSLFSGMLCSGRDDNGTDRYWKVEEERELDPTTLASLPENLTDTEFIALIEQGIDPIYRERLWNLERIRNQLTRISEEAYQFVHTFDEQYECCYAEAFTEIASIVNLVPRAGDFEVRGALRSSTVDAIFTQEEIAKIDSWTEKYLGVTLSQMKETVRSGINPLTGDRLIRYPLFKEEEALFYALYFPDAE